MLWSSVASSSSSSSPLYLHAERRASRVLCSYHPCCLKLLTLLFIFFLAELHCTAGGVAASFEKYGSDVFFAALSSAALTHLKHFLKLRLRLD